MSIDISSTEIVVTEDEYSFLDIYDYAKNNNKTDYIKKLGNSYEISVDLRVKDSGKIRDSSVSITVLGELIQIHKGCSLTLGKKRENQSTYDGCILNAPNIKTGYGFGCTDKNDSGDLFLYGSVINVFGFWGFFSGDNHVEVIDCSVDGFGRIEGEKSILKNISHKRSHGKYGILTPKGTILECSNLSVSDSIESNGNRCSVYHNPKYAGNMTVIGGSYSGYDKLAYIEDTSGGDQLVFIDSVISNGYSLERETDNVDFFHKYTFNPVFMDDKGSKLGDVKVTCVDKDGNEVFSASSNQDGEISETLVYYFSDRNGKDENYPNPYSFEIEYNDISLKRKLWIEQPYKKIPFFIANEGSSSTSNDACSCDDIQNKLSLLESTILDKLTTVESNIVQFASEITDDLSENHSSIENNKETFIELSNGWKAIT